MQVKWRVKQSDYGPIFICPKNHHAQFWWFMSEKIGLSGCPDCTEPLPVSLSLLGHASIPVWGLPAAITLDIRRRRRESDE